MQDTQTILKINLQDNWSEVTLGQYMEITSIEKPTYIDVISILIDQDPEIIRSIDVINLNKIVQHLSWYNTVPNALYSPIIKIDDIEYGFISNLSELTVGEWIDLEAYIENTDLNMHKIMAVIYRPLITAYSDTERLIEAYDAASANRRADLFKEKAMIGDMYGALFFFSNIAKESMVTMKAYFQTEIQKMKK